MQTNIDRHNSQTKHWAPSLREVWCGTVRRAEEVDGPRRESGERCGAVGVEGWSQQPEAEEQQPVNLNQQPCCNTVEGDISRDRQYPSRYGFGAPAAPIARTGGLSRRRRSLWHGSNAKQGRAL